MTAPASSPSTALAPATLCPDPAQAWSPEGYQHHAGFVAALGAPLLNLAGEGRGRRALDLGCGDGVLSQALKAQGWQVLGVDADAAMVAACRARGVEALQANARVPDSLPPGPFDLIFSNAAMHWMGPLAPLVAALAPRMAPGARLVVEMGGHGNVAAIRLALHSALRARGVEPLAHDPWTFPTVLDAQQAVAAAGLHLEQAALIPRPTSLPTGLLGWLETFADALLRPLDPVQRQAELRWVERSLKPILCDSAGGWTADYVRLRFTALTSPLEAPAP